jgi:outer membrane protein with beta-barrel domain
MQKLFLIVALTLALPVIAQAQEGSRVEVFGGYSYMRLEDSNIDGQDRDLNGYNISGAITIFKKSIALKGDVSGHFGDLLTNVTPRTDLGQTLFLFGPQFRLRNKSLIQPFAHALFGVARVKLENDAVPGDITDTGFAFALGGGVDVKGLGSKVAVRLIQADYVRTKLDLLNSGDSTSSSNFRISTGIVLRFGKIE